MPTLKEYTPQQTGAQPMDFKQAKASDFGMGAITGALGDLGQGISEGAAIELKRTQQEEASKGSADLAVYQDSATTAYSEYLRTAGPNDPDKTEEFTKRYEEGLSKIGEGFSTPEGKMFFEKNKAEMVSSYRKMASAGQVELARARGGERLQTRQNALGNSVRKFPASLESVIARSDISLEEDIKNGIVDRETAHKLRPSLISDLTVSAMQGQIAMNPAEAKKILDGTELDNKIDAKTKNSLYDALDQELRARRADAAAQDAATLRARTEAQRVTQDGFIKAHAEKKLNVRDVLNSNLEAVGSGSKDFFIKLIEADAEKELTTSDPTTVIDTFRRIRMKDGEKGKIYDESDLDELVLERKLTIADWKMFREEVSGGKSEEGRQMLQWKKNTLDVAKVLTTTNPLAGVKDQDGDKRLARFEIWFEQEFRKQRAEGVPVAELLSPNSPKWLGHQIGLFKATPQEVMDSAYAVQDRSNPSYVGPTQEEPVFTPATKTDPKKYIKGVDTLETWQKRQ